MRFYLSIFLCLLLFKSFALNTLFPKSDTTNKDFVIHEYDFERKTGNLNNYVDSLIFHSNLNIDNKTDLINFKNIFKSGEASFALYIDSILDMDSIPAFIMDVINFSLTFTDYDSIERCMVAAEKTDCAIPASALYNYSWCDLRPHPYTEELIAQDTLLEIILVIDSNSFHMPGIAPVTSRYGWRDGRMHHGIDLGIYHSLPVHSSFSGVVRYARNAPGYGRLVIIRHHNGLETYYAHLSRIRVKPGDEIAAGDIIGNAGNSGTSRGTHLHYEMRFKGVPLNPAHIICFNENKLIHDKILLKKNRNSFFVYNENAILYKVQRGDYLHKIATEFGTTVRKLRANNDIPQNGIIKVGQIIRIEL